MRNLWLFNEKRLAILEKLLGCNTASCCDLKECLRIKKTLLSYHLGLLRDRRIIKEIRRGREKYYRIRRARLPLIRQIIKVVS